MSISGRKARQQRYRKRVAIRFGTGEPLLQSGFTTNLSARGMGLTSKTVHPPGRRIILEARLRDGTVARAIGVVAWARRGSSIMGIPSSMGIRLEEVDAGFHSLLGELSEEASAESTPPPATRTLKAPRPRAPRMKACLSIHYGSQSPLVLEGMTLDVSATGLALATAVVQPPSTPLLMQVELPQVGRAEGEGRVVWTRPLAAGTPRPHSMGIRLQRMDEPWFHYLWRLSRP